MFYQSIKVCTKKDEEKEWRERKSQVIYESDSFSFCSFVVKLFCCVFKNNSI
jgi:ATP-dependent Clp protease adapter protein ClpS